MAWFKIFSSVSKIFSGRSVALIVLIPTGIFATRFLSCHLNHCNDARSFVNE